MAVATEPMVLLVELAIKEGEMDRFLALAADHARATLAEEPGGLHFDIVREGEIRAVFYEVYRDAAAVEAQRARPQWTRFQAATSELVLDRRVRELRRASAGRPPAKGWVLCAIPVLAKRRELVHRLSEAGYEVVFNEIGRSFDAEGLRRHLPGVRASIAGIEPYDASTLAAADALEIVARFGVGHDQVDLAACTAAGVAVAMAFGANHEAVADHTLGLMAAVAKRLVVYDRRVRDGQWGSLDHGTLHGATLGLVGFGRIGCAVAMRARGFAIRIPVHDPEVADAAISHLGGEPVDLDRLLAAADFVSLHAPAMRATRHFIGAAALARMRRNAHIIDTARGSLIYEAALIDALESGRIAGAGLDVFEVEPLPADSPLAAACNGSAAAARGRVERCRRRSDGRTMRRECSFVSGGTAARTRLDPQSRGGWPAPRSGRPGRAQLTVWTT